MTTIQTDIIRQSGAKLLVDIIDGGAYANIALAQELRRLKKKAHIRETDRRFLTELVYGAVKTGETLDYILGKYVNRPLDKISPIIRSILRLGIYQLFYMDKVPPFAAVNEAVNLAKKYSHDGTAKFVNAVLRSAVREPNRAAFVSEEDDLPRHLSLKFFHPLWLVKKWLAEYGREQTHLLLAADNTEAPLTLRTNTTKISRDELIKKLNAAGAECLPADLTPEGITVNSIRDTLDNLAALQTGLASAQDLTSMLVAHIAAPKPDDFVIDACSSPGGKATHIAELVNNRGRVLACDIFEHKLKRIEENKARLGARIVEPILLDARKLKETHHSAADIVLVDAPCSGLGVLRRKVDLRWKKNPQDLAKLPALQREILDSAAQTVKSGGTLVYSTCTIEAAENEKIVEDFLRRHENFHLDDARKFLPCKAINADFSPLNSDEQMSKMLHFYPQRNQTDGFFIARMIRS